MDCLKELQKLSEQMREVMYLRAMSDLSYREIGEIMGNKTVTTNLDKSV